MAAEVKHESPARQLLWNIFASGLSEDSDLDVLRKLFLLNLIGLLGSLFLCLFLLITFLEGEYVLALADFTILCIVISLVITLRVKKNPDFVAISGTIITGLFYLFLIFYSGMEKPTYLWGLTYPLIALYLLGRKLGTYVTLSLLLTSCLFFGLSPQFGVLHHYDPGLVLRYIAVYLLVYFFAFVAEIIHDMNQGRLEDSGAKLLTAFNEIKHSSTRLTDTNKLLLSEIEERIQAEKALKQSESFLDDIIESIQDGISVINPDLTIRHTNSVMKQWYKQNEPLVGNKCHECYHNKLEPCNPCPTIRCLKTGQTEREIVPALEGSPVDCLELFAFPIIDKDSGDITGVVEFVRDISTSKRLERQLAHSQKMQAVGTLAGGIAHDFNNLLMGIQGRTSLMSVSLPTSDPNLEHLSAIEEHISSATDLTRQLLGTARGGKYNPKPTDLNELVEGSSKMFGRTRKELKITVELNPLPVIAEIDKQQFEQVLLNMYLNSWQAMPDGGELSIKTSCKTQSDKHYEHYTIPAGTYAEVSVTDTGIGMNYSVRQQIFDPFFTTKEKERGTGLGLASAYGIIRNHQGFVNVYSEVGHGTTFTIYLPISDEQPHDDIPRISTIINGSETILLVDDEDLILEVGRAMLSKLGYQVIIAKGGDQAIKGIQAPDTDIDLIILDLIMPGMDGDVTFDKIKQISPSTPVILSSGYSINDLATNIMNKGCNGFIQKPFNLSELSRKIRSVLNDENKTA